MVGCVPSPTFSSCPPPAPQAPGRARHGLAVAAAQKVSDLPQSLQKIVGAFQMVPDPMARYKQLLFYATKLEKLPDELHIPAYKVEGCVSQVRGTAVQQGPTHPMPGQPPSVPPPGKGVCVCRAACTMSHSPSHSLQLYHVSFQLWLMPE